MATAQRQQRRSSPSGPDPASRGLILVLVAVALGAILLVTGGTVGFDEDDTGVDIGSRNGTTDAPDATDAVPSTTAAPVTVPPAEVKVVASNGAGISGLAGTTTDFLATQGYTNSVATDAPAEVASTAVYFAEGFQPNAAAIATLFGLPPEQVQPLPADPVANDQPADAAVIVALGPDAEAAVAAPPTTAAPG